MLKVLKYLLYFTSVLRQVRALRIAWRTWQASTSPFSCPSLHPQPTCPDKSNPLALLWQGNHWLLAQDHGVRSQLSRLGLLRSQAPASLKLRSARSTESAQAASMGCESASSTILHSPLTIFRLALTGPCQLGLRGYRPHGPLCRQSRPRSLRPCHRRRPQLS